MLGACCLVIATVEWRRRGTWVLVGSLLAARKRAKWLICLALYVLLPPSPTCLSAVSAGGRVFASLLAPVLLYPCGMDAPPCPSSASACVLAVRMCLKSQVWHANGTGGLFVGRACPHYNIQPTGFCLPCEPRAEHLSTLWFGAILCSLPRHPCTSPVCERCESVRWP